MNPFGLQCMSLRPVADASGHHRVTSLFLSPLTTTYLSRVGGRRLQGKWNSEPNAVHPISLFRLPPAVVDDSEVAIGAGEGEADQGVGPLPAMVRGRERAECCSLLDTPCIQLFPSLLHAYVSSPTPPPTAVARVLQSPLLTQQQQLARIASHNRLFGASKGHIEVDTVVPKRPPHATAPQAGGPDRGLAPLLERGESTGSTGGDAPITVISYPLDSFHLTATDEVHEARQGPGPQAAHRGAGAPAGGVTGASAGHGAGAGGGKGTALSPSGIGVV